MGILGRIKRITTGKLELFLSRSENPETLFPQLIVEMETQVQAATEAEAKAMASVRQAEKAVEEANAKLKTMTAGATAALSNNDEGMAREAIEAQVAWEAELIRREAALQVAESVLADARAARQETQAQLKNVRLKKDEILTRASVVRTQERIQRTVAGPSASTGSILDAVEALEAKVEEKEANLAIQKDLTGRGSGAASPSLERRLDEMNRNAEIDRRLAALKATVQQKD